MSKYVEIQVQSPAEGFGFVAQWYAGGERSGQAFPLLNTGVWFPVFVTPRFPHIVAMFSACLSSLFGTP